MIPSKYLFCAEIQSLFLAGQHSLLPLTDIIQLKADFPPNTYQRNSCTDDISITYSPANCFLQSDTQ